MTTYAFVLAAARARWTALLAGCLIAAACTAPPPAAPPSDYTATIPPTGTDAGVIRRGESLMNHTRKFLPQFVRANMNCSSCHINAGRTKGALSLVGIFGRYPQFSRRTNHVVGMRDRIAECFLFSMNGEPPSYYGRDLIAIEAYIAFLSIGARVGPAPPSPRPEPLPTGHKDAGATLYASRCVACHGANGAGNPTAGFPALWGSSSFNNRAGMNHVMPVFVKANMPLGQGGTLTDQEAADVSAYVLRHRRPTFDPNKLQNVTPAELKDLL
jgi:thiosulfate dehydrogenase